MLKDNLYILQNKKMHLWKKYILVYLLYAIGMQIWGKKKEKNEQEKAELNNSILKAILIDIIF